MAQAIMTTVSGADYHECGSERKGRIGEQKIIHSKIDRLTVRENEDITTKKECEWVH